MTVKVCLVNGAAISIDDEEEDEIEENPDDEFSKGVKETMKRYHGALEALSKLVVF